MGENANASSKFSYFLVGLGLGALAGILFAPRSGDETREYLLDKAEQGKEYAQRKARELRERAEEVVEHGRETVNRQKENFTSAVDAGRKAYEREKTKAQ